jgi:hypothetical protein
MLSSFAPRRTQWIPFIYAALGQAGWFVSVVSAAKGAGWIGAALAALLACGHLAYVRAPGREVPLLLVAPLIGWLWDSVPVRLGCLHYPNGMLLPGTAPYWMMGLWLLFAAQINTVFRWMRNRTVAASLLGCVAGPLSFRAGAALGAVEFVRPAAAYVLLGCAWAVLMPTIVRLGCRFDGVAPPRKN